MKLIGHCLKVNVLMLDIFQKLNYPQIDAIIELLDGRVGEAIIKYQTLSDEQISRALNDTPYHSELIFKSQVLSPDIIDQAIF